MFGQHSDHIRARQVAGRIRKLMAERTAQQASLPLPDLIESDDQISGKAGQNFVTDQKTGSYQSYGCSLVVRHNRLIESRHKMTMAERRFILWNIAQINKDDTSFRPFEISVRDYFDVIGLRQTSNPYEIVKRMHDRLTQRNIGIEKTDQRGKKGFSYMPWFAELEYRDGRIYSLLNFKLMPYLLQLKQDFTSIAFEQAMILDGFYTGRMYDLLAQYRSAGGRIITADFIRDRFHIKDKYPYFKDLRTRIVDPAVKEINAKTDMQISYEIIREGRRHVGFKFSISKSEATVTLEDNREEAFDATRKIFRRLMALGVKEAAARKLIAEFDDERILWHINDYENRRSKGKEIGTGWLVSAIREDYRPQTSLDDLERQERTKAWANRKRLEEEWQALKDQKADLDRLKRISDMTVIKELYGQINQAEKDRIEREFISRLEGEPDKIKDFRKNGWDALGCMIDMRRFWYEYNFQLFTDIADIAEEHGQDYRALISRISEIESLLEEVD